MRVLALFALVALAIAFASASSSSSDDLGTIISITAQEDPPQNYMLTFPASNASAPIQKVDYNFFEFTTAGAIDLVRGRYLLMWESMEIGYYNLSNLAQLSILRLPVQQLPDAMHYDATNDLVWLIEVGDSSFSICKVTAGGIHTCVATAQGSYSYTADASTYDEQTGVLYVQLMNMNKESVAAGDNEQPLFIYNIAANTLSGPISMIDLCQEMDVAVLSGGVHTLVCVDFITNILVKVDQTSGKFTPLFQLPGTPQPYTSIVDNSSGKAVYYAECAGWIGFNHWVSYDIASGQQLHNSTVDGNLQLSLPFYIPPSYDGVVAGVELHPRPTRGYHHRH